MAALHKFLLILKKRAKYLAKQKGHHLGRFDQIERTKITRRAFCANSGCGMVVFIKPGRMPAEVFGAAINETCRGPQVQP